MHERNKIEMSVRSADTKLSMYIQVFRPFVGLFRWADVVLVPSCSAPAVFTQFALLPASLVLQRVPQYVQHTIFFAKK